MDSPVGYTIYRHEYFYKRFLFRIFLLPETKSPFKSRLVVMVYMQGDPSKKLRKATRGSMCNTVWLEIWK